CVPKLEKFALSFGRKKSRVNSKEIGGAIFRFWMSSLFFERAGRRKPKRIRKGANLLAPPTHAHKFGHPELPYIVGKSIICYNLNAKQQFNICEESQLVALFCVT
ncbi:MAG: hypothetical protein UW87_C0034G0008, partial [Candidatus Moranbacteria bacterium GW2011_GWC2_45_10]